ncbi:MAG: hypothetical protein FD163_1319 [Hyphomonadaceae bacterium]|nr:MAG: hypothetical protein FD128_2709 [Hyphomonadaceae bacterium]KAF0185504.1 MAG: hypothetical protein FD163_1319 [Hyphomonadaceae bacterium]
MEAGECEGLPSPPKEQAAERGQISQVNAQRGAIWVVSSAVLRLGYMNVRTIENNAFDRPVE